MRVKKASFDARLERLREWLAYHEPVDDAARVRNLIAHLNSPVPGDQLAADQALREIAFSWDGAYRDYYDVEFVIALLKALAEAGDSRVLPYVEELANGKAATPDQKRVRDAARECLPLVEGRAKNERDHRTLLRPSDRRDADRKSLLRPAGAAAKIDDRLLLRPEEAEVAAESDG